MIELKTKLLCRACAEKEGLDYIIGGNLNREDCPVCGMCAYLNEYRLPVMCGQVVGLKFAEKVQKKYKLKGKLKGTIA